jgi:multidrug efflux pump subunit AcrB
MNIVRLALKRPISIIVMTIALALAAFMAIVKMPRDILPSLGIPTIYVVQPYGGMDPSQMESYITYYYEYHFLYVSGIEHIESQNVESAALIKLQFYPGTDMAGAMSETVANVERSRAFMPPGTVAPFIIRYDAGGAPVGNLVFTGENLSLGQLQDLAINRVRPLFATLKGVSSPPPFGASAKTIVVNVDPAKMAKFNLAAAEVAQAIADSNTITPSGNIPVGNFWPMVPMNGIVKDIDTLLRVPLRIGTEPTVYLKDVGTVVEGTDIPTCYALVNGKRTIYIPVTKRAEASTLEVVDLVKKNLPRFQALLPDKVKVDYEFDQSVYVRESIKSLVFEGVLGAILTGLMVLLFLRDLRSVAIVVINIPLALMASLCAQWLTGQTVNVMTLGGLALAVGILVDETTVTIENIHVHLDQGKSIASSALDATMEILKPELLTLLCVLSVFVPSFFMQGVAKALFIPLTIAVGFSMIGSFLLSRTLVPVLAAWWLKDEKQPEKGDRNKSKSRFDRFRESYAHLIQRLMQRKRLWVLAYLGITLGLATFLLIHVGKEMFPIVNEGQFKVRLRAPIGSSLDTTEKYTLQVLGIVNSLVGKDKIKNSLAFVGQQPTEYAVSNVYQWSTGTHEAMLQVALKQDAHIGIENLKETLRQKIRQEIPDLRISFEPSGLIDSMMSQGSPTPIQISVNGPDLQVDREFAAKLMDEVSHLPYLRDLGYGQIFDYPTLDVDVDRPRAGLMGLTIKDIAKTLVPATSSTRFTIPNFWSDPKSGINYQVQVEVPQGKISSLEQLKDLPVTVNQGAIPLRRFAEVSESKRVGEYDRYNMQRRVTITANLFGKDLGHATAEIKDRLKSLVSQKPRGVEVSYLGQMKSLDEMFDGLGKGLVFAIVVIFLLLSGNFESFTIALAILGTVPAVLAGSLGILVITGTTLNIESFMGTIMAIGIAVANSILLVTFAERDRIRGDGDAEKAAVEGAQSRLRPILMTSSAMLMGMIPLAMGWSEGGKQSSPLGRAVMGGLFGATLTTLFILPQIYAWIQSSRSKRTASLDPDDQEGTRYEDPKGLRRVGKGELEARKAVPEEGRTA